MIVPFLLALPWLGVLALVLFVARKPPALPPAGAGAPDASAPFVTVVVPARNEARNIEACVRSLAASSYPAYEIVVVDDRSEDDTARLAAAIPPGGARDLRVVAGRPLPEGWLGKPWACHQGAAVAAGDLLLFTDADTTHGPLLLERAVAGMREEGADLLTLAGRQLMETFWERLVQPHIFMMMVMRFPRFERVARSGRWREAIANGQFLLFGIDGYRAIGGHEAVRDEVVEDLVLAQHVKRAGLALRVRSAEDDFATRMYRSLGELVDGWSKNIVLGGLQSFGPALRPLVPAVSLLGGVALWLAPPAALAAAALGLAGPATARWAATACALSAVTFGGFTHRMGGPWRYGFAYPLGAAVGLFIFVRSWRRGRSVEWKGRRYTVPPAAERA